MLKYRWLWLACAFLAAGSFILGKAIWKPISLRVDGIETAGITTAWTVGGAIESQGIHLTEENLVYPRMDRWVNSGDTIVIHRARWFLVRVDGDVKARLTAERIPANVLAQAGVRLFPGDQVLVDGLQTSPFKALDPGMPHSIDVLRARRITISGDSQDRSIYSSAHTLGQALWNAGIRLDIQDALSLPLESSLDRPRVAVLDESRILRILLGDNDQRVRSSADTVGEALLEAGIGLQGLDYSLPDPQSPVPANGIIRVVRVEEKVLLEVEPIPFETETELSDDLEIDTQGVIQPGVYGIRARRTRLRFEDGIEVSRWVESEYVAQEPGSQVMGYGTKIVRRTLDTPDGEITYWRALNMYAVSYKPSSAGDNITATGAVLQKGIVAIDPNYIPYGTRMYIPGYGFGLAADTGGGVKGRLIDLGYSDEDYVSWHQWVTVYFLWPPPEFVAWIIP
jgi:uncharacterized protein YabE (DUF348 family)